MYIENGICHAENPVDRIRVTDVRILEKMMMLVTFSTEEKRLFDASRLTGSAFTPLGDEKIFSSPEIRHGVISWKNGEIDIAPETVYEESIPFDSVKHMTDALGPDDISQMLSTGLEQIERGETVGMEEVFSELDS